MPRAIESSTERTISRSPSSAARLSRKAITSGKLWPVSMCSSGKGNCAGRKAFSARRSRQIESLPPENSSAGLAHCAGHLAQDVDGLGLEPVEVGQRGDGRCQEVKLARSMPRFVHGFVAVRLPTVRCRRHADVQAAFLGSGLSHHQRPARMSSPAAMARVQGAQPMLG